MSELAQATLFDFAALDPATRIVVQQEDKEYDSNMEGAGGLFIRACHNLKRIHHALRYGHPGFVDYCRSKEGLSYTTALERIRVAEMFTPGVNISITNKKVLYLLAAPSTPEPVRHEALARAEQGETITHAVAKDLITQHREQDAAVADEVLPFSDLLFPCPDCGEEFSIEVWHCKLCDHHWSLDDDACNNCHGIPPAIIEPAPVELATYDGNEWYTPPEIINAARIALGHIDLDPASCEAAQRVIQADMFYTKAQNGLTQPWSGRVWCNPPYSYPDVEQFTTYAVSQYRAGICKAAILLVNNCTDAAWFIALADRFPVMFTRGRSKFWRPNQASFATRQGQALFYLGDDPQRFYEAFQALAYVPNGGAE